MQAIASVLLTLGLKKCMQHKYKIPIYAYIKIIFLELFIGGEALSRTGKQLRKWMHKPTNKLTEALLLLAICFC